MSYCFSLAPCFISRDSSQLDISLIQLYVEYEHLHIMRCLDSQVLILHTLADVYFQYQARTTVPGNLTWLLGW